MERRKGFIVRLAPSAGFTLVEILVVVAILGLLMTVASVALIGHFKGAQRDIAKSQMQQIKTKIDAWSVNHNGQYPSNEDGLDVLLENIPGTSTPSMEERHLTDPWGNRFRYRYPGERTKPFDLYSLGADGEAGGEGENEDFYYGESDGEGE